MAPVPSHEIEAIPEIKRVVRKFKPELIIELGTYTGGMTYVFQETCPGVPIHTFDDKDLIAPIDRKIYGKNVHFHVVDILTEPHSLVVKLCRKRIRKFIYCDNGNKVGEIWRYAYLLRSGDLLGAHDYGVEYELKNIWEALRMFKPLEHRIFEKKGVTTRFWKRRE